MPNSDMQRTAYIFSGNPDTLNVTSSFFPLGQLGERVPKDDKEYQLVKCDSGCTSATATGVVAANQLAFWKDQDAYLVTNDSLQALGGQVTNAYRNFVAGVFRTAVTAGNYCAVLQKGDNIAVKSDGNGGVGQTAIANSGTAADTTTVAVGTAPTYQVLGIFRAAASGGNINTDLRIQGIP